MKKCLELQQLDENIFLYLKDFLELKNFCFFPTIYREIRD